MGSRIHGITVTLYEKTETGTDAFGRPVYKVTPVQVENVLVGEPTSQEIVDTLNLTGKRLAYILGIPKGDAHIWADHTVEFFGSVFHVIGPPVEGIESLIPLDWNRKVKVEQIE